MNMPSRRMLPDTVTLFNYIGEVNMVAEYLVTIFTNVFCDTSYGDKASIQGGVSNNAARLYIFDMQSCAYSMDGKKKKFVPFSEWEELADKSLYWTIREDNKDYFAVGKHCVSSLKQSLEGAQPFPITKARRYNIGTPRMRHWEIDGC